MLVTDVGDDMYWWHLKNVGDGFDRFGHKHQLSFYISVGHKHSKDVNKIKILSPASLSPRTRVHELPKLVLVRDDSKFPKDFGSGSRRFESSGKYLVIVHVGTSFLTFSLSRSETNRFWSVRSTTFIIKMYENTGNFSFRTTNRRKFEQNLKLM